MSDYDYKNEIVSSRVGNLGSSDAKMMMNIAKLGYVPTSAQERLAIAKGLVVPNDSGKTTEMIYGDYIEKQIFEMLSSNDLPFVSNPCWISKKFSKKNVNLICHPDIVRFDDNEKTIFVYEVKATKFNVKVTKETYRAQMFIEWTIANEVAAQLGKEWKVKLYLAHYDTVGTDVEDETSWSFAPEKLSLHKMAFSKLFDVDAAMNIIDVFLKDFNEYYKGDEIESEYLPANVQDEFNAITNVLTEIKERETKVAEFKDKLYAFMCEKGIKSIKNEAWSITRVDPTESVSFNAKAFLDEYAKKYPRKAKKLMETYEKRTKRKGYVNIKLK